MFGNARLRSHARFFLARRRGYLTYFGEKLRFPADTFLVRQACEQGIYEQANLGLLQKAVRPSTWVFDIGANIGLMSAPLLREHSSVHVVSVEPSPSTREFLSVSARSSQNHRRWHVVAEALGEAPGTVEFHASPDGGGAYDGIRNTGRAGKGVGARVPMTTLDELWGRFGRPPVSALKIDTEGAESLVLRGSRTCLEACRPFILLEWNPVNLEAHGLAPESLADLAGGLGYRIHTAPFLVPVINRADLPLLCRLNETFVLLPE